VLYIGILVLVFNSRATYINTQLEDSKENAIGLLVLSNTNPAITISN